MRADNNDDDEHTLQSLLSSISNDAHTSEYCRIFYLFGLPSNLYSQLNGRLSY